MSQKKLIVNCPINSLSLGQVSYNILREIWREKQYDVSIFPFGHVDVKAYNNAEPEFKSWIESCVNNRFKNYDVESPSLKIWHINGSEQRHTKNQVLYTFYECDAPTPEELNIVKAQNATIFSSKFASKCFDLYGDKPTFHCGLGFDEDILKCPEPANLPSDVTQWILVGKWEKRKNTETILRLWKKKYGGNRKHRLIACIFNPFLGNNPQEQQAYHNQLLNNALEGNLPFNMTILPHLETNEQMNQIYKAADIDLSGLSSSEGWGLPAFNATALGKWSIVSNCSAHKDWANENNSILVKSNGKHPCYDGMFFHQGLPFNQGNFFTITPEEIIAGMEKAEKLAKTPNTEGLKLQTEFTYNKTWKFIQSHL